MESVAAFFDDSGELDPGSGRNIVSLGMLVISVKNIRELSSHWFDMISHHLRIKACNLSVCGIEAKSSELYELKRRLEKGQSPKGLQVPLYNWGLNTPERVEALIDSIWEFLSKPCVPTIYLASVANKSATFQKYQASNYQTFLELKSITNKKAIGNLRRELILYLGERLFEWLLQRLNYLGNPSEWDFPDAFIVGDESAVTTSMYKSQAIAQAGFSNFTRLPKIANNVWFGSSTNNPCLQIADWIAYAIRTWGEMRQGANMRLKEILPYFRGYPDKIFGRGIIPIPSARELPKLPK